LADNILQIFNAPLFLTVEVVNAVTHSEYAASESPSEVARSPGSQ
jgi:hypothetical protein